MPLIARTVASLRDDAADLDADLVDLVELRIDHLDAVDDSDEVLRAIETVRETLPGTIPLLFTFRSRAEGGRRELGAPEYEALVLLAIASGSVDAVDVEMFTELGSLERLVNGAHAHGLAVVMSSHDFEQTPPLDQIVARLTLQQDLGADIVKIAVMPRTSADVLVLLQATETFVSTVGVRPAITMSMGPLGAVSRVAGEVFGSCATFGSIGAASAPGQIEAHALRQTLDLLHDAQTG